MKLAVVQYSPIRGDVTHNIAAIVDHIRATDANVIVLPELATSGYFFYDTASARPFARHAEELEEIIAAAKTARRTVVCGFLEGGKRGPLYNSALIALSDGATMVYRKTHRFYREVDVFAPGDTGFFVIDLPDVDCRLGTMICYDWRFPESARTLALKGADVIACPSNLVTHIWRTAMPVRALENKVWLAVANRSGEETVSNETVRFNGDSVIYTPAGAVAASCGPTQDETIIVDIDPLATRDKHFNTYNDIFADRRPDMYA